MNRVFVLASAAIVLATSTEEARQQSLKADVGVIAASSTNEERFNALTAILKARHIAFEVEPFTPAREPWTSGRNVIVTLGEGTEDIVVAAHYDAARLPTGALSHGAVDNASSSVLLIRVVEALAAEKFSKRVKFIWFDMEEEGLLGSAAWVKAHSADRIAAMLNFDVNAYGSTILFGPSLPANADLRRTFVETCASEAADCVSFSQMPPSDHRPFVSANIPTVSIAILPPIEAHQLWLMMNAGANSGLAKDHTPEILRTIHTPNDVPDKVDEESMAKMLRFAVALVGNTVRR